MQGKDLFAVIRALGVRIVGLAELRLDDLHLLAQQILLLRLIQAVLRRFLKLMLQAEHTRLVQQHFESLDSLRLGRVSSSSSCFSSGRRNTCWEMKFDTKAAFVLPSTLMTDSGAMFPDAVT